jgi:hypothetical protein
MQQLGPLPSAAIDIEGASRWPKKRAIRAPVASTAIAALRKNAQRARLEALHHSPRAPRTAGPR